MSEMEKNKKSSSRKSEHFQFLFESASDCLLILDLHGTIIDINESGSFRLGYTKDEMIGQPISKFDSPDFASHVKERIAEVIQKGSGRFESAHIHKDGTVIPVEVNTRLIELDGKKLLFSIIRDVTKRKKYEDDLKAREEKYRAVIETSADGFWMADATGKLLEVNDVYVKQSGYSREELLTMKISDLEAKENPEDTKAHIDKLLTEGHDRFESLHRRKDGSIWPVEIVTNFWPIEDGIFFVFIIDITERKKSLEQLHLMALVFQHAVEAMLITDKNNRIININESFAKLTGYTLDDVQNKNPKILASGRENKDFYKQMWRSILEEGSWQGEVYDRRKDGSIYPKYLSINTVRNSENEIAFFIGSFMDITERKLAENKIRKLAYSDTLTGLHNRLSLISQFEQELSIAKRSYSVLAMLFIDLDRFKVINDTLGHQAGDLLLIEVSERIRTAISAHDVVARLGGDEFVVILNQLTSIEDAASVAMTIIERISDPYELEGHRLITSASIGISGYPNDGKDATSLMQNADTAMYQAKNEGGKNFKFFNHEMNQKALERLNVENGLYRALEKEEFEIYYQPQISRDGNIEGVEALIRWNHPTDGLIPPDRFIPVAEETGIILPVGRWIVENACRALRRWMDSGHSISRIAVNLSIHEFLQDGFDEFLIEILQKTGISPHNLELELTESMAMTNPEKFTKVMHSIKETGIRLSIDDFGTGYSSLAYLGRFPIDTIKLDRSFIEQMQTSKTVLAIIVSTIELAGKLGMDIIAEGVQTGAQSVKLFEYGCKLQQGFYFSKPIPENELIQYLDRN